MLQQTPSKRVLPHPHYKHHAVTTRNRFRYHGKHCIETSAHTSCTAEASACFVQLFVLQFLADPNLLLCLLSTKGFEPPLCVFLAATSEHVRSPAVYA